MVYRNHNDEAFYGPTLLVPPGLFLKQCLFSEHHDHKTFFQKAPDARMSVHIVKEGESLSLNLFKDLHFQRTGPAGSSNAPFRFYFLIHSVKRMCIPGKKRYKASCCTLEDDVKNLSRGSVVKGIEENVHKAHFLVPENEKNYLIHAVTSFFQKIKNPQALGTVPALPLFSEFPHNRKPQKQF